MSHRILLIEDDQDLLHLYRTGLEKDGFVVHTSANGLEGIHESIDREVDLILLDMMMPLADGRDVLAMLRLNKKTKDIPVIIISNIDRHSIDLSMLDDQVIDYWLKADLTPKTLSARLMSYFSS